MAVTAASGGVLGYLIGGAGGAAVLGLGIAVGISGLLVWSKTHAGAFARGERPPWHRWLLWCLVAAAVVVVASAGVDGHWEDGLRVLPAVAIAVAGRLVNNRLRQRRG